MVIKLFDNLFYSRFYCKIDNFVAIIGGGVGAVISFVFISAAAIFVHRRKTMKRKNTNEDETSVDKTRNSDITIGVAGTTLFNATPSNFGKCSSISEKFIL